MKTLASLIAVAFLSSAALAAEPAAAPAGEKPAAAAPAEGGKATKKSRIVARSFCEPRSW